MNNFIYKQQGGYKALPLTKRTPYYMNIQEKKKYSSPKLRSIEIGCQQLLDDSRKDQYEAPKNIYKDYYEEHTLSF